MIRRCVLAMAVVGACGDDSAQHPSAPAPQVVEVGTVEVQPQRVALATELPGRTAAYRNAEVHARVDGIVLKRLFVEGGDVKEGQSLFQIDPAPYEAALAHAKAQVASAQAEEVRAKLVAQRDTRLIATRAIAKEEYDTSVARAKSAVATVEAAKADVNTAQINLAYTRVEAPISGRTGRALVTEGAYVRASQATPMATVTQLDPIYVDTSLPSIDLLRVRREIESGQLVAPGGQPQVTVILEDGRPYRLPGKLLVTGVNVDETTGSVALRALVPNPRGELLPGMYVRAMLQEGVDPNALLVPQRAVTRDRNGQASALVVKQGKVELRKLQVGRAVRDAWLVTAGIAPGDHVIVDGQQRVRPGMPVREVPAPASIGQPQPPAMVGVR